MQFKEEKSKEMAKKREEERAKEEQERLDKLEFLKKNKEKVDEIE